MRKAVFLDRDGTINVEKNYLYKIEDFELLPGVMEGMKKLYDAGFLLIIVTNQSGIGRGYYTEEDFAVLNDWMMEKFRQNGVFIEKVYYCPHLPDAKVRRYRMVCNCRKPSPGLYERAVKEYDIDLTQSWTVGDKLRDSAFCENTSCRGLLVGKGEPESVICAVKNGCIRNVGYAPGFLEAADIILTNGRNNS